MIPLHVALPLACLVLSTLMGAAIVGRDPGLRIHQLVGALLAATAWWALCETLWQIQDEPAHVLALVRLSSVGWMALGPVCLHIFSEISGRPASLARRAVPLAYACAAAGIAIYQLSPTAVPSVFRTVSGAWAYALGPAFVVPCTIAVAPPAATLVFWRRYHGSGAVVGGERLVSSTLFAGVVVGLTVTLVSEVALPALGVEALHVGTASITAVGILCARQLTRYGFSLLSPAAFAREILDTLGDGIVLLYANGTVRFTNRAMERLAAVGEGGLTGHPVAELLPGAPTGPDTGPQAVELELCHASGARVPVAVSAVRIGSVSTALVVRDLREVWSLRDRVVTGGRLATVGELAAVIAREIETPAEDVTKQLETFRSRWRRAADACDGRDAELRARLAEGEDLIEECVEGVVRVGTIARSVGHFESAEVRAREAVEPDVLVEAALEAVAPHWPAGVGLDRAFGGPPAVPCAPREIVQVVTNLLANALAAVGERGAIRVETGANTTEAWIAVTDDGPGIAPDVRDRMFDPFFSTRPTGEGVGLGLPVAFHLVERNGGELRHAEPPEGGARFEVRLPLA